MTQQRLKTQVLVIGAGISGSTSVAPMRGCAPLCLRMSISSAAFFTPAKAASTTASGEPTNVTTVRLVASPGIDVQHFDAPGGFDGRYDPVDYCLVASLAEVGDAFHDTLFHMLCGYIDSSFQR